MHPLYTRLINPWLSRKPDLSLDREATVRILPEIFAVQQATVTGRTAHPHANPPVFA